MRYWYLPSTCMLCILIGAAPLAQATPEPQDSAPVAPAGEKEPVTPPQTSCGQPAWYCGVSKARQKRALELYRQGNQLFDDSLFLGAVNKYEAALQHWNHPSIHYNLMLALVALDRPIEGYESSIEALRHGPAALKPEEYRRARDYQMLLRGRIAVLEVTCDEPDAVVSLNGKPLFHAPGTVRRYVHPGRHELVASKSGYLVSHRRLLLLPEQSQRVHVAMLPASQAMISVRPAPAWQPWAVVGAGVGVGVLGTAIEWRANVNNGAFRDRFSEECKVGCKESEYSAGLKSLQTRYTWYRRLGHGVSATGAATVLTGLALVYLNWPKQIDNPERRNLFRISMTPEIEPDSARLSVKVDF